ncbi:MAG TPA: V-type ATPase 116kDa subunit family protein [Candidatus Omnitrophota bacterium]|nr:V-type ATPase 116kDa subunit family protein [Candidatus Omnitrophota bacterium]HRZ14577.1 V-type ATPase 116kDa subunit family protein [Candidatus Omnitrophota bacterium]
MITPAAMELVSFVVLRENVEAVAAHLLKLGIFHPVDIRHIEEKLHGLSLFEIEKENNDWSAVQTRVRDVARKLRLDLYSVFDQPVPASSVKDIEDAVDSLEKKVNPLLEEKEAISRQIETDQSILSHVNESMPPGLQRNALYSFLDVSTGKMEEKNLVVLERSLADIPHVIYPFRKEVPGKISVMVMGLRRDRVLIDKVLRDVAWEAADYSSEGQGLSQAAQEKLTQQIANGRQKMVELQQRIAALGQEHAQQLQKFLSFITLKKSLLEAQRYSCTTEKTALFSGWVPRADKERVVREIKAVAGASYVESKSAEQSGVPQEEVPVRFQHNATLKPFEMLIEAYGVPRYGTVDPTLFVAISFLLMFGAMFGDLGHGLVLVCIGLLIAVPSFNRLLKPFLKAGPVSEGGRRFGTLILYCGISSSVFGVLYGSFFGFEFPSLWIKPMENVMEAFRVGIGFGVIMISLGIVINVFNAFRDKDYAKAFFDKAGLVVGLLYWAGIGLVSKILSAQQKINPLYFYLVFGSILVLFLFPIVENILFKKHASLIEAFFESIVNMLEIFMGYLSNTVSFIRVAAFALAHTGLFLAIFGLSHATESSGNLGSALAWLIIIGGNILVVCLEGLVVSIQSIRLNYYEFFSKFFIAGKQMYKPLSLT